MPVASQRIFAKNCELENNKSLESYGILHKSKNKILLIQKKSLAGENTAIEPYGDVSSDAMSSKITGVIKEIKKGMDFGLAPQLVFDGTSGTYFMRDQDKNTVAVFKPIDEEAFAPNNPWGYIGEFGQPSLRNGVRSGEGVIREVASFLMDHHHFSWVPPTIFAEAMHPSFKFSSNDETDLTSSDSNTSQYKNVISSLVEPTLSEHSSASTAVTQGSQKNDSKIKMKYGSLQYFVRADDMASNFSSSLFSVDEVHKIAILDLRIMNLDRNDGNLLVKKEWRKTKNKTTTKYSLIPIDHAMSIPDSLEVYSYDICWMEWDQIEEPFSSSSLKYINSLDVLKDIKMLDNTFKFRKIWLRNIRITGTLLKIGAEHGLTLSQIGSILWREDDYDEDPEPSMLEKIVTKAQEMSLTIRKIRSTHLRPKLDSVDVFKNRNKTRRTSMNNKNSDEILSKIQRSKISSTNTEENKENIKTNFLLKARVFAIGKEFEAFEKQDECGGSDDAELEALQFAEPSMSKFASSIVGNSNNIELKEVGKRVSQLKRERAQSENDTDIIFSCETSSISPKKSNRKYDSKFKREQQEKREIRHEDESKKQSLNLDTSSDSSSANNEGEEEEGDTQESCIKSPPIKRTVSLPRIKILENRTALPKIKEEEEFNNDVIPKKDNSGSSGSAQPNFLSSVPSFKGEKEQKSPLKVKRQKSTELEEIQLKDSPYDEDFFYYFELYLEESIKKINNHNQNFVPSRTRSRSDFN